MRASGRFEACQAYDADVSVPCAWRVWDRELGCSLTWRELVPLGFPVPSWSVPDAPALLETQADAIHAAAVFAGSLRKG